MSLSQANTLQREMVSLEATTFPSGCSMAVISTTEEEPTALRGTGQLGAGCFCLNSSPGLQPISCTGLSTCGKEQATLNHSHGRKSSSSFSLTCISDTAGREL